jgi:ubiquinone/menaquinone biosynthesis C-methylase UbiE/uncharacterized protein YbaR (Trm112 family)
MKNRLQELLCCPTCGGNLGLRVFAEEIVDTDKTCRDVQHDLQTSARVVKEGVMSCSSCRVWYPILEYIPVMLTFVTPVHGRFAAKFKEQMNSLSGYTMPKGQPNPGERSVQETFSDEWNKVQDNELSFLLTADDLVQLNQQVWLRPLQSTRDEFKTVLNVGVGLGQETLAVQKAVGNAEIVGVDLNFALLQKGRSSAATPNFHLVIASLFHLPFRRASFDLVYSQGVIHHTYSTKAAFESIARFVRPGGHLFTWVYALESHLLPKGFKGLVLRANWHAEGVLRPLISRFPKPLRDLVFTVLTTVCHPLIKTMVIHKDQWKWQNTDHGMRDWLSPRFAHRHSYNEFLEWYENRGFDVVGLQSPSAYRRLFGKQLYGVGVLGQCMESGQGAEARKPNMSMDEVARTPTANGVLVRSAT